MKSHVLRFALFALLGASSLGSSAVAQEQEPAAAPEVARRAPSEKTLVRFHLTKDPQGQVRGWLVDFGDDGFRYKELGAGGRTHDLAWADLVEADRKRLRIELRLDLTEDERLGLVEGHELHFKGGGKLRGLVDRHVDGTYWVRQNGMILPYPERRVERVEKIKIQERDVFTEDDVYIRRLQRIPPQNAHEHVLLAHYMYDIGNWQKAEEHYGKGVALDETLTTSLVERRAEVRDYIEDEEAGAFFRKAKSRANLHGDYAGAIQMIEEYSVQFPGSRRRGLRVIDSIQERRFEKLTVVYHKVKAEELARQIRRYLTRRKGTLAEAESWVTSQLQQLIEAGIRTRLGVDKEEFEALKETRAKGAPHFTTYGSGSFVKSDKAKRGATTKRQVRGDPEDWWVRYGDTKTRGSWLTAFAVEKLPEMFEIVQIRRSNCSGCGGKGVVKRTSATGLEALGGAHEWWENCKRCYGAQEDRGLAYR